MSLLETRNYFRKKTAEAYIKELNQRLESAARHEWELTKGTSQLGLQGIGGLKPVWKFTKATGAYFCKKTIKEIDW